MEKKILKREQFRLSELRDNERNTILAIVCLFLINDTVLIMFAYLDNTKDSFIPASFQGLPALVWIQKPYKINSTDVPSMIPMTHPLYSRRGKGGEN